MQRVLSIFLIWFSSLFVLYACTTTVPHAPAKEKPVAAVEKPLPASAVPASAVIEIPASAVIEIPAPVLTLDKDAVPHIALLLPLHSKDYGAVADAVLQGFMAAADRQKPALPIRVYSDFDENSSVVAIYRKAVTGGARAVVGPMTRGGVSALAAEHNIQVPTLTLNIVEGQPAQLLYYFGVPVEAEARQAAQLAMRQGLHQAIIITSRAQWTKRLQSAFEEEWFASGGGILRETEYNNIPGELADITDMPDTAIFLAADAKTARLIRPYLPNKLPIFATSQIFTGNDNTLTNYDLNGIRFVDMPWLLQPDHPAVMSYQRANPPLSIDRERLYALGIDAFRLTRLMLSKRFVLPLDGVTGDIYLRDHVFQRMATPALFLEGRSQLAGTNSGPAIQMFPDQVIETP
jgi:hypothetical protein